MNLFLIFLTGLTVGGLTCLAVQGGLLASIITTRASEATEKKKKHALYATLTFLIAKLIAYTFIGFLLGAFGGAININGNIQIFMQLMAGIYMIVIALNLLNVHPLFRHAIIQPPRFLTKHVRNQSKSKDIFAPSILGAMTIFIPCGTTLAMETLAISSANALQGTLIMFFFILGTMPLFFGVGFLTSFFGEKFKTSFLKIAAVLVILLGIISIHGAVTAFGFNNSFNQIIRFLTINDSDIKSSVPVSINQNPTIEVSSSGYSPTDITVKKGKPVTLTLIGKDAYSCAAAFRIPSLGIAVNLKGPNDRQKITFTPNQSGQIQFTCSMGMYSGVINVL